MTNGQIQENQFTIGLISIFFIFILFAMMDSHFENHDTKHPNRVSTKHK